MKCLLKHFCDDSCNTIEDDSDSSLQWDRLFDRIAAQSGLKINHDKTEILRLVSLRSTDFKIITFGKYVD